MVVFTDVLRVVDVLVGRDNVEVAGKHDLWDNETEVFEDGYLTDLISRRAVNFLRQRKAGQPFLMSVHYTAPHWPWETREDRPESLRIGDAIRHADGGSLATYRKMINHMDEGIGWVLAELEAQGLAEETLVVFTSDNGGERFSDNWPLVGGKMDLTEGGIRVPWIAHWPAAIPAGRVSAQHCMTMDWSATMLHLGGGQPHPDFPLDGVDLRPVLRDPAKNFDRPLYWRMNHRGQRALRDGDWKYLRVDGHDYLFDIPADERERANQAHREPARLQAMRDESAAVFNNERPEIWREKSGAPRTAFAAHHWNEAFGILGRHPRHPPERCPLGAHPGVQQRCVGGRVDGPQGHGGGGGRARRNVGAGHPRGRGGRAYPARVCGGR